MRRILHVSDVHFGPKHLPDRAAGLLRLVEEKGPDFVAISGDLTQRAKPRQFRAARAWVDSIPVPSLAVPGNHDVPMYRAWERALSPFGAYRRHFSPDLEPAWSDAELTVVGVNSAHNLTVKDGRISHRRLGRIGAQFAGSPATACRVAVIHHELVPAPRFGAQKSLTHAHAVLETLVEAGVELVLSGHLHQAYVVQADSYYPDLTPAPVLVHAGTSCSSRGRGTERGINTCNWVRVESDRFIVTTLAWSDTAKEFLPVRRVELPRRTAAPDWLAGN